MSRFLLLLVPLLLFACAPGDDPVRPASFSVDPLERDPAFAELADRAGFLPRRFLDLAPKPASVQAALLQGPEGLDRLLDLDPGTAAALLVEIRARAAALRARHRDFDAALEAVEAEDRPACAPEMLVEAARRLEGGGAPVLAQETRVKCQWLPYLAGLVGCAATGNPVFYTACAMVVACTYCEGGWVSSLCQH